jgi:two-component system chemotaxis sensor kinase CheA
MEQILEKFLKETTRRLDEVRQDLQSLRENQSNEQISRETLRSLFRHFHTLKGSSITFGFEQAGQIAHRLEDLVEALRDGKKHFDNNLPEIIETGVRLLEESLHNHSNQDYIKTFVEKLNSLPEINVQKTNVKRIELILLSNLRQKLSANETKKLHNFLSLQKSVFVLEYECDFDEIETVCKPLTTKLNSLGEIIANLPTENQTPTKIGFRTLFATDLTADNLLKSFSNIKIQQIDYSQSLHLVWQHSVFHGKDSAARLGKSVKYEFEGEDFWLSEKQAQALSVAFLHLIRNAVDHGIEELTARKARRKPETGLVKLTAKTNEGFVFLTLSDDGRGIDWEKVRQIAVSKGLAPKDATLSETELHSLLFEEGFSTAPIISEISGRGIGLETARHALSEIGGRLSVESELNQGTVFTIKLPV